MKTTALIKCNICGENKPPYMRKHGALSTCIDCHKARQKEYRKKYYKERYKTHLYIMNFRASVNRWNKSTAAEIQEQINKTYLLIEEKQKYIDALEELLDSKD